MTKSSNAKPRPPAKRQITEAEREAIRILVRIAIRMKTPPQAA
jgi:hypothetical protein